MTPTAIAATAAARAATTDGALLRGALVEARPGPDFPPRRGADRCVER
jgi:hypothetical protein